MTENIPNTTTGEFCPDWPARCICPIDPAHIPLPVQTATCGHCGQDRVLVPRDQKMPANPGTADLVTAGAHYCDRCRNPLCDDCGDRDPHQVMYDCSQMRLHPNGDPRNQRRLLYD